MGIIIGTCHYYIDEQFTLLEIQIFRSFIFVINGVVKYFFQFDNNSGCLPSTVQHRLHTKLFTSISHVEKFTSAFSCLAEGMGWITILLFTGSTQIFITVCSLRYCKLAVVKQCSIGVGEHPRFRDTPVL